MKKIYLLLLCLLLSIGLWAKDVVPKTNSTFLATDSIVTVWDMSKYTSQNTFNRRYIILSVYSQEEAKYTWEANSGERGSGYIARQNGNGKHHIEIPDTLLTKTITLRIDPTHLNYIAYGNEPNDGKERLVELKQWGRKSFETMNHMFYGCDNMVITAPGAPDLSLTVSMNGMFSENRKFNQDISHWNTVKVKSMANMFINATSFNQNIENWDVRNVIDMSGMFLGATSFNQRLSNWRPQNITNMSKMFSGATAYNQPISWYTPKLTNISGMFSFTTNYTQDISTMTTSAVTDMSYLFEESNYNQPLSSLYISSVTNMEGMFKNNTVFNQPLNWNTQKVTNMSWMFGGTSLFNQPLNWDTQNVTNMSYMFSGTRSFNGDIEEFNTSKVTDMTGMFSHALLFNGNLNSWNVSNVENMSSMFSGALSFDNYISSWDVRKVTSMSGMFQGAAKFNKNINSWKTDALIYLNDTFNGATAFNEHLNLWNISSVTYLNGTFQGATSFNRDISAWNTGQVITMQSLFKDATAYNQNIANWNTTKVQNMSGMFDGATSFNRDLSNLNVSTVVDMSEMFKNAILFDSNIGNWDVSKVTSMKNMFEGTKAFNADLKKWDVSKVTNMESMFHNASIFNKDLGKWEFNSSVNLTNFITSSGLDCANFSSLLISWANQPQLTSKTISNSSLNKLTYGTNAIPAFKLLTKSTIDGGRSFLITNATEGTTSCYLYDAPTLSVQADTTIYHSPVAVKIDSMVTITNKGNVSLKRASVKILKNFNNGDVLSFENNDAVKFGVVTATYVATLGLLNLNSTDTLTKVQWENIFSAVKYNTSVPPIRSLRSVEYQFNDSTANIIPIVKYLKLANPKAPIILIPTDSARTKNQNPVISGTAEINRSVSIYSGSALIGATTTNNLGEWTFTPSDNLDEGTHTLQAKVIDALGFESELSSVVRLTIDITAPTIPTIIKVDNGSTIYTTNPTYTGIGDAQSIIKLYLGNTLIGTDTTSIDGKWSIDQINSLNAGTYEIYVTATDDVGNVSEKSAVHSFTVDLNPTIHIVNHLDELSTIVGTASEAKHIEVSGTYMLNRITAVVSTGFEISLDSLTYSSSVNFGAAGQIAARKIYVRITSRAPINPTMEGTIVLTNPNANTEVVDILNAKVVSSVINQEITFNALTNKNTGDPIFNLSATATSGLPVSYTSSAPDIARIINGNQVEILKAGIVVITASQAGNVVYIPAVPVQQILVIEGGSTGPSNQVITFAALANKNVGDPVFNLTATASSGLPISYSSSAPEIARIINGNQVEILKAGTLVITSSQDGNANFSAAFPIQQILVIEGNTDGKLNQNIVFTALSNKTVGDLVFNLTAIATSGLEVSYTSSSPSIARIVNGNQVEILKAGTVVITASQIGNDTYNAALPIQQILVIDASADGKLNQVVTFNAISNKRVGDALYTLTATASSGLPVSYFSSSPEIARIVNGNQIEFLKAGTLVITANQSGNENYYAASSVQQILIVEDASAQKVPQTITFNAIGRKVLGDPNFNLSGVASSGLPLTYTSSDPSIARIVNVNQVEILAAGSVIITANQSGDATYLPALTITQILVIDNAPMPVITITSDKGTEITEGEMVILTASGALSYVWENANGILTPTNLYQISVRPTSATTYAVLGTDAFNQSANSSITITVIKTQAEIVVNNILTPNGDGINDTWVVDNIQAYPNNIVKVFDTSGKVVFEQKGYDNNWNGTFKNMLLEGTYFYMIDLGDGSNVKKGSINIFKN